MRKALALLLLLFVLGCEKAPTAPQLPPVEVSVFTVTPMTVPAIFEFVGQTESSHLVEIRARVQGYLDKIAYQEGSMVEKGALLFQLDPAQFVASVDRSKGMLQEQEALLWKNQQDKDRMVPLYAKNAASRKDLDDATANVLAKQASVTQAKAQLEEAELNLSYATITTPVTGLAGKSYFREGALITPSPGEGLLTTVAVLDPIWVNFNISDNELLQSSDEKAKRRLVYPPDMNFEVRVILGDGSLFPETGRVSFAQPWLDPTTGTLLVRAQFSNPDNSLKPGQFVRVQVSGAVRPNALFVPQGAVMQGQKGKFVYVLKPDGSAEMRPVMVGEWFNNYWLIFEGLQPGEKVVVEGISKVQPGKPLRVTKEEPIPAFKT